MNSCKDFKFFLDRIRDSVFLWEIGLFDFDEYLATIKKLVEEREAIV